MKLGYYIFPLVCGLCLAAHAGFLQPTSFPSIVDDLSFIDRIRLKADGYDQIETEYDKNGKCVSGCAYAELNLEDELDAMARRDALVRSELVEEYGYEEQPDGSVTPPTQPRQNTNNMQPKQNFPGDAPKNCSVINPKFTSHTIPSGSPLGYVSCITSDYGVQRNMSWYKNTKVHRGIDLAARVGMPIYAPADGTIVTVYKMNESCGNGIIILHANGYRTKYCHLSDVSVTQKAQVSAGCLIGKTGNTGKTTGPHLHYAVEKWDGKSYQATNPRPFIEPNHQMCR